MVLGDTRFEDCLAVRYEGPITGTISVAGGPGRVHEARFERVVWWKEGVGPVREVITIDGELELPEGGRASVHEVSTLRLVRHRAAR